MQKTTGLQSLETFKQPESFKNFPSWLQKLAKESYVLESEAARIEKKYMHLSGVPEPDVSSIEKNLKKVLEARFQLGIEQNHNEMSFVSKNAFFDFENKNERFQVYDRDLKMIRAAGEALFNSCATSRELYLKQQMDKLAEERELLFGKELDYLKCVDRYREKHMKWKRKEYEGQNLGYLEKKEIDDLIKELGVQRQNIRDERLCILQKFDQIAELSKNPGHEIATVPRLIGDFHDIEESKKRIAQDAAHIIENKIDLENMRNSAKFGSELDNIQLFKELEKKGISRSALRPKFEKDDPGNVENPELEEKKHRKEESRQNQSKMEVSSAFSQKRENEEGGRRTLGGNGLLTKSAVLSLGPRKLTEANKVNIQGNPSLALAGASTMTMSRVNLNNGGYERGKEVNIHGIKRKGDEIEEDGLILALALQELDLMNNGIYSSQELTNLRQMREEYEKIAVVQRLHGGTNDSIPILMARKAENGEGKDIREKAKPEKQYFTKEFNLGKRIGMEKYLPKYEYSSSGGFNVIFDQMTGIEGSRFQDIIINFGVFLKGSSIVPVQATATHALMDDGCGGKRAYMKEKVTILSCQSHTFAMLIMEVSLSSSSSNHKTTQAIGWTGLSLFDLGGQLKRGRFRLPLIKPPTNLYTTMDKMGSFERVPWGLLYVRLGMPEDRDPMSDLEANIDATNYFVPEYLEKINTKVEVLPASEFNRKNDYVKSKIQGVKEIMEKKRREKEEEQKARRTREVNKVVSQMLNPRKQPVKGWRLPSDGEAESDDEERRLRRKNQRIEVPSVELLTRDIKASQALHPKEARSGLRVKMHSIFSLLSDEPSLLAVCLSLEGGALLDEIGRFCVFVSRPIESHPKTKDEDLGGQEFDIMLDIYKVINILQGNGKLSLGFFLLKMPRRGAKALKNVNRAEALGKKASFSLEFSLLDATGSLRLGKFREAFKEKTAISFTISTFEYGLKEIEDVLRHAPPPEVSRLGIEGLTPQKPLNNVVGEEIVANPVGEYIPFIENKKAQWPNYQDTISNGLDIYVDGIRHLPSNASICTASIRVLASDGRTVAGPDLGLPLLDSEAANPRLIGHLQVRLPSPNEYESSLFGMITIQTIPADDASGQPVIIGYSFINAFVLKKTGEAPDNNISFSECAPNFGCHEVPVYYDEIPPPPLAFGSLKMLDRLPCVTLLLRILPPPNPNAKLLRDYNLEGIPMKHWRLGNRPRAPIYEAGAYSNNLVTFNDKEKLLMLERLKKENETGNEKKRTVRMKAQEVLARYGMFVSLSIRKQSGADDEAIWEFIDDNMRPPQRKTRFLDPRGAYRYKKAVGFKYRLDGVLNLSKEMLLAGQIRILPDFPEKSQTIYSLIDEESTTLNPMFKTGYQVLSPFRIVSLSSILLELFEVKLSEKTAEPFGWSVLPLVHLRHHLNSGTFQLPIYKGAIHPSLLDAFRFSPALQVLASYKQEIIPKTSAILKVFDNAFVGMNQYFDFAKLNIEFLPPEKVSEYEIDEKLLDRIRGGKKIKEVLPGSKSSKSLQPEIEKYLAKLIKKL